jgi:plastocyanin
MKSRWGALVVLALVLVAGLVTLSCKKKSNPAGPGGAADVTINIIGAGLGANAYSPNPDTVTVGQTVAWHNTNGITHTATSDAGPGSVFNTGNVGGGGTSAPITMTAAGSYPYHCAIHGAVSMSGTLVVKP